MRNTAKKSHKGAKIFAAIILSLLALVLIAYFIPFFVMLGGMHGNIGSDSRVMIIFGYQLDDNGMAPILKSRLDTAIDYIETHPNVTVIVSGGNGNEKFSSEAQCMRDYLVENGVAEAQIIVEDKATTTVENIKYSLQIISERNLDVENGVIMVSSDFHLARIRTLAKRAGVKFAVNTLSAPTMPASAKHLMRLREPFAMIIDFLTAKF